MATAALISGPIASGKSTVAQALHRSWPGSVLLDGDDHDAPDGISLQARWSYALWRLSERLRHDLAEGRNAVVAWPLTEAHYACLQEICSDADAGADVFCVTLCPPLDVALTGRGRTLEPWERERVRVMYAEGYAARPFSHLLLDSAALDPAACAREIMQKLANV